MIEINLIPDVKRELLRIRMMRNAVISMSILVGIVSIAIVVFCAVVLGGQLAFELKQDSDIKSKYGELSQISDLDKTVTLQQQLGQIDRLHNDKKINSRLLSLISAINPPAPNNVQISMARLNPGEKTITLEGSAVNGFAALEVLKKTLTSTKVKKGNAEGDGVPLASDMKAGETTFGENAEGKKVLRFAFTFTYPDDLFTHSKETISIITPTSKTNVTDSRLGVPESLFSRSESTEQKKENQ